MKRLIFTILITLSVQILYADGSEEICVLTNATSTGEACSANQLGLVNPCATLIFRVKNLAVPNGFVAVAKFEWFVNTVSVKVNSTNPLDNGLEWQIKSPNTTVYCNVYYKKQNGDLSEAYTSSAFTPDVKQMNFRDNGIVATTPMPNYGCTSGTVSFSPQYLFMYSVL